MEAVNSYYERGPMKSIDKHLCEIIEIKKLNADIFDMTVNAPEVAALAKPGQFVHIYIPGHILRRPISICQANKLNGTIRLLFQIRGVGTEILSRFVRGCYIDMLGPLGNGFPVFSKDKKVLLVGGGIGVPPLLEVAGFYREYATVCLGFRSKEHIILEDDFIGLGAKLLIATEDGSTGIKGYVSELFDELSNIECIYACGPEAMLHTVCSLANKLDIPCYISLEERMACGMGACLGCACELLDKKGDSYYGHVCKDGPVFSYKYIASYAAENKAREVQA